MPPPLHARTTAPAPPAPRSAASVRWPLVLADAGVWTAGLVLSALAVAELDVSAVRPAPLALGVLVATAVHLGGGAALGAYRGARHRGGRDDLAATTALVAVAVAALLLVRTVAPGPALAVVLAAGPVVLVLLAGVREAVRRAELRRLRPAPGAARTVVVGAGDGGAELVRLMLRTPDSPYLPVALVDDDDGKHRPLHGVPVRGGRAVLADVVAETRASVVVVAVAQADRSLLADVTARVAPGVEVAVLPSLSELLVRPLEIADVRPISPADLLGRQETRLDAAAIAGYLTGRRVMVTGAGGSIGSELCRQVATFSPSRLVMLDRDESALHAVQLSMAGRALLDQRDLVVADIRDAARLDAVFAEHHPEVVFHAAALKHLPLLQMHPGEALKTNVVGTANVLAACSAWGVGTMVNVSTDKAADPSSVLGSSKRVAERLTAWWSRPDGRAISVRFGNVLGSRGSVLTTFTEQIRRGGPVTVTDPEVTRYFMTVEEAVGLVVQAGAVGRAGEVLVLDMGEPVSILEVVQRLMGAAGVDLDVQFTGLRPGEKLHEVLFAADEADHRPVHPMVSHVPVPALDPAVLDDLDASAPDGDLVRALAALCTAPAPPAAAPAPSPAAALVAPAVPAAPATVGDRVSA